MENPLRVSLENIIPLTEARDHFSQIVNEVQKDKLYILTKGGKPAVAIVDVKYLEHITGGEVKQEHVQEEIKKNPEKVGLPPMIEHQKVNSNPPAPPSTPPAPKPFVPPAKIEPPKPAGFAAPQPPKSPVQTPPAPPSNPVPPKTPSTPPPPPSNPAPLKTFSNDEKIDVKFDTEPPTEDQSKISSTYISSDDKASPDQYAGKAEEPEDMSID